MAFTLKSYIKRGLIAAVGKMADYQIILNSAGWMEKGVLTEDDLVEIQAALDAANTRGVSPPFCSPPEPTGSAQPRWTTISLLR